MENLATGAESPDANVSNEQAAAAPVVQPTTLLSQFTALVKANREKHIHSSRVGQLDLALTYQFIVDSGGNFTSKQIVTVLQELLDVEFPEDFSRAIGNYMSGLVDGRAKDPTMDVRKNYLARIAKGVYGFGSRAPQLLKNAIKLAKNGAPGVAQITIDPEARINPDAASAALAELEAAFAAEPVLV